MSIIKGPLLLETPYYYYYLAFMIYSFKALKDYYLLAFS